MVILLLLTLNVMFFINYFTNFKFNNYKEYWVYIKFKYLNKPCWFVGDHIQTPGKYGRQTYSIITKIDLSENSVYVDVYDVLTNVKRHEDEIAIEPENLDYYKVIKAAGKVNNNFNNALTGILDDK